MFVTFAVGLQFVKCHMILGSKSSPFSDNGDVQTPQEMWMYFGVSSIFSIEDVNVFTQAVGSFICDSSHFFLYVCDFFYGKKEYFWVVSFDI